MLIFLLPDGTIGASGLDFTFYSYNPANDGNENFNMHAEVQNAFYVANVFHDFTYRYGFTERMFNFQETNNGWSCPWILPELRG